MGFPLKESNPYPNLVPISWLTRLAHFPVCGCGVSRLCHSIKWVWQAFWRYSIQNPPRTHRRCIL